MYHTVEYYTIGCICYYTILYTFLCCLLDVYVKFCWKRSYDDHDSDGTIDEVTTMLLLYLYLLLLLLPCSMLLLDVQ